MNQDSGFGTNGVPYEYTVSEAKSFSLTMRRILLILLYVAWCVGFFMAGVITKLAVPMIAIVPLTLWVVVLFTWRLTQVEYEYSYFSGELTVSRVLGGRTRRVLAKITLRDLTAVYPCDEPYLPHIEAFGAQKEIFAASGEGAEDLFAALWTDEQDVKHVLYFEPTEKALKILKYYNRSAVVARTVAR